MEENASNALMMTASVLIGLNELRAFVLLFVSFSNSSARIEERLAESQIKEFNAHYEIFAFSKEENGDETSRVSIYDIVSLINFTKQYNHDLYSKPECDHYNQDSMPYYVVIKIDFGDLRNYEALHDVISQVHGYSDYQEAEKDDLDVLMQNAYFDNENIPENWETADNIHRFECKGIKYNEKTLRVNEISFEYVGVS